MGNCGCYYEIPDIGIESPDTTDMNDISHNIVGKNLASVPICMSKPESTIIKTEENEENAGEIGEFIHV